MLSAAFNDMADALQERIQREVRFTADVSHELRSPLTTVSTALAVLETRRSELSDRGRSALDLLAAEIDRFGKLVEDLLEISRNDTGAVIDLEPVSLAQIVLHAQMLSTVQTPVRIQVDSAALGSHVLGDKRRLERIIANLLDNADRYAFSAVAISLRREPAKPPSPAALVLTVDDDGPGIPAKDRERLFDRFARGTAAPRRGAGGGAGLGLALVRQHVKLHSGTVSVETSALGGACFVVRIPEYSPSWREIPGSTPRRQLVPSMTERAPLRRALLGGLILMTAACGVSTQSGPHPLASQTATVLTAPSGRATRLTDIYFLRGSRLVPIARAVPDPVTLPRVLQTLLSGPTPLEASRGLRSAIPAALRIQSVRSQSSTAVLDLDATLTAIDSQEQALALAQLVFTATTDPSISAVRVLIEGKSVQVPRADGTLTDGDLTRGDYGSLRKTTS